MTSQPGWQTLVIHILSNTSRSKGNQTMKFCQLINYNIRIIFIEKSYTQYDGEISTRPFSEKLNLSISLDQQSKVLYSLFNCMPSWGLLKYIETKLQITCLYLILRFFKKTKRSLELVSLPYFLLIFLYILLILLIYSIYWPSFIVWLTLLCEILGNMCILFVC